MPYLGIFDPKMPHEGISGLEFEKNIVKFGISILEFVLLQSLVQKQKSLNLRSKMSDLGIFGLKVENNVVKFEISTLEFV